MIQFPKPDVEQFLRTYSISHFTVNKDETKLVYGSNLNGKFNLWTMDLPHTYPYPLTFNDQSSSFVTFDPHDRFLLTDFDNNGDENYQIYALPVSGGNPQPLVTGDNEEKYFYAQLSEDGNRLYYMTSRDNPSFLDVRRRHLNTGDDDLLFKGQEGLIELEAVHADEQIFAYIKMFSNTYMLGYVMQDGEDICLTPDPNIAHTVFDMNFIDESHLLFVTNYNAEFSYVASFDLNEHTFTPLQTFDGEDVKELKWHKATRTAFVVTAAGVVDHLYALSMDDSSVEQLHLPVEVIGQLEVGKSGTLYLLGISATASSNLFKQPIDQPWQQLTKNRVPGVPASDLIDPEVVTYPSYDGKHIESLLFRANDDVSNGYTVFWPHGGPQAAERKSFRGLFQFLLAQGYHIFTPNFRGSTGYGASFTKMVEGDWGEGPRLDCVAGIEWLFANGIADRDKLFLVGGSYGGYMTLLLAGRHPEYFRAAVDLFGPSNLFTFIESVPDHWKPIMTDWVGDPVADKERLTKDSPITYLEQMRQPMLVIQGANDPRVVKAESDQIVAQLKDQGTEVEYLVLDDEGHGFSNKENEIKVYRLALDFIEKHK